MIRLIKPSIKYRQSFLEAVREFQNEGRNKNINLQQSPKQFVEFISRLINQEKGMDLPKGYVPSSTYWLIDNDKFIGKVSIRHRLTEKLRKEGGHIGYEIRPSERKKGYGTKILKMALPKTRQLGIKKVLVTCDENNISSKKIIENNGGILENKLKTESGKMKLRYWINVENPYSKLLILKKCYGK